MDRPPPMVIPTTRLTYSEQKIRKFADFSSFNSLRQPHCDFTCRLHIYSTNNIVIQPLCFQSIPSVRKITYVIIFCREYHIDISSKISLSLLPKPYIALEFCLYILTKDIVILLPCILLKFTVCNHTSWIRRMDVVEIWTLWIIMQYIDYLFLLQFLFQNIKRHMFKLTSDEKLTV